MISGSKGGWIAAGILVAVFAAGGLTGAAVVEVLRPGATEQAAQRGENGRRDRSTRFGQSDRFIHFMQSRLELNEEQVGEIREVLERNEKEAKALYESIRPDLEEGVTETRAEIREVLSPEQFERFDEMISEERGRRRRRPEGTDPSPRENGREGPPPGAGPNGPADGQRPGPGGDAHGPEPFGDWKSGPAEGERSPTSGEPLGAILRG